MQAAVKPQKEEEEEQLPGWNAMTSLRNTAAPPHCCWGLRRSGTTSNAHIIVNSIVIIELLWTETHIDADKPVGGSGSGALEPRRLV